MFLATTALSEFWDKKQKILFLGPWCLLHDRQNEWRNLDYEVMENPWNDREHFYEAGLYAEKIYEKYLQKLTLLLNETHGVNFSENYWRIIIGPWLFHYIEAFYDRYCHILRAFEKCPNLKTWLLSPDDYTTPVSYNDFTKLYTEDDCYNLQFYSQIIRELGFDFPSYRTERHEDVIGGKTSITLLKRILFLRTKDVAKDIIQFVCWLKQGQKVVLADLYFSSWEHIFQLIFLSPNAMYWNISAPDSLLKGKYGSERRNLFNSIEYEGEFERILLKTFSINFPVLYLEGYHDFSRFIKDRIKQSPHAVMSSTGWYSNEAFKFYAAEINARGGLLCGYQHGGGYGHFKNSPVEKHEIKLSRIFYTWGWVSEDFPSKTKSLPRVPSLKRREKTKNNLKDILFICTNHPRYLYRFHSCPVGSQFDEYIEDEMRFVRGIKKELYSNLVFRLYMADYQRNIKARITAEFPNLRFDNQKKYIKSIERAKVVVVDHLATTFLITLASNIPTILFWNPRYWEVRSSAQPFFDKLRRVGILHDTPESAAAKVNEIYEDTDVWWRRVEVQDAKDEFCQQFALTSDSWLKEWKTEFYNLANKLED